ncbi:MAG: hypothetical protein M3X11_17970, partial [Acidobacteriota bacterium]|nr:hypothetical protein [Acidobacteriota bacterium]
MPPPFAAGAAVGEELDEEKKRLLQANPSLAYLRLRCLRRAVAAFVISLLGRYWKVIVTRLDRLLSTVITTWTSPLPANDRGNGPM